MYRNTTSSDSRHVLINNNYYPYGLLIADSPQSNNRLKYNAKEKISELGLNWYDYGARMYHPAIGRWNVLDPLADKMQSWSPYSYTLGNPIKFIDVEGKFSISVHYDITYKVLSILGYTRSVADKIAHYSSVYADHPPKGFLFFDNMTHMTSHWYRNSIVYSFTLNSQAESNSIWHSMMSNAEAASGMTHTEAMQRGLSFGWDNIFAQQNGEDLGKLGQGLHALQDAYAHKGASTNEHLGFNLSTAEMFSNDMYGSTNQAKQITKSAGVLLQLFKGNSDNLKNGMQFDFTGMSNKQLTIAQELFYSFGYNFNQTNIKGFYSIQVM